MRNSTAFTILLLFISKTTIAQVSVNLGAGVSYSKGDLNRIQSSFESYLTQTKNSFPNDPYSKVQNWSSSQITPHFVGQLGYKMSPLYTGINYHFAPIRQSRQITRQSDYGRRFDWSENRGDILIDFGWTNDRMKLFASLGTNIAHFKMASYQVYPDQSISINNEFTYNGLYKGQDVGFSYGFGGQITFKRMFVLDLRYYISTDQMPGDPEEALAIVDNSFSRTPGTNQLPQDYTLPQNLDNEVLVGVRRSFLQFTLAYNFLHFLE